MNLSDLLGLLRARGLDLSMRDGRLLLRGPTGMLDAELRAAIETHRSALVDLLEQARSAALPQVGPAEAVPLTATQRSIFVDDAVAGGTAYHMPFVARLPPAVNLPVLSAALVELAAAHPALTSRYYAGTDGSLLQQPLVGSGLVVERRRVAAAEVGEAIAALVGRPFDLTAGDVLRAALIDDGAGTVRLCVVAHHIAADGWSAEIMKRDLSLFYARRIARLAPDPRPDGGFARYAGAAARRGDRDTAADRRYWHTELAGVEGVRAAGLGGTATGGVRHDGTLSAGADAALGTLAAAAGTSRYSILVAAVAAVMAPVLGCNQLLVAAPRANRSLPGAEDVVGPFLDTLPLRIAADGREGLLAVARSVAGRMADAGRHAGLTFAEIRSELARAGVDVAPALSVNLLDYPRHPLMLDGEAAAEEEPPATDPKYDLTVYAEPGTAGLALRYHARATAIPAEVLAAAHARLDALIEAAAAAPETPVADLLRGGGGLPCVPAADPGASIPARFRRQAAATPHATALVTDDAAWTYAELARRVDALHAALAAEVVPPASPVCIVATRCRWLVVAILACLQAGRPYTVWDAAAPSADTADAMAHLGIATTLIAADRAVMTPPGLPPAMDAASLTAATGMPPAFTPPYPHAAACLTWTSGSTGEPMAVIGSHAALTLQIDAIAEYSPIGVGHRGALLGGLANDPLQRDIFTALCNGASVAVPSQEDMHPERLRPCLAAHGVTTLNLTPGMAAFACAPMGGDELLDAVTQVWLCGDVVGWAAVGELARVMPAATIVSLYGMTESQRALTAFRCREAGAPPPVSALPAVPLGSSGPGAALVALDHAGRRVRAWEIGDLYLLGGEIALGYAGRPRETALRFVPAPRGTRMIRTGDRARPLPDGGFAFAGRAGGEVNLRGVRFATAAVDRHAEAAPGVTAAHTLLCGDGPEAQLVTFWTGDGDGDGSIDEARLRAHLRDRLPPMAVPARAVRVAGFPLTASGKVDRAGLAAHLPLPVSAPLTDEAARNVAAIWRDVLGVAVGADTDFFAAGGHSLQAIRLSERLGAAFGRRYPVDRLLGAGTLAECVAFYRDDAEAQVGEAQPTLAPRRVEPDASFPLTDVQQAYWLGRRSDVAGGSIPTATYIEFALPHADPKRLRAVLGRLVGRHAMLRTIVTTDGMQRTLAEVGAVPLEVQDLHRMSAVESEAALDRWRTAMAERRFDPQHWPLFEVRLSLAEGDCARLHLAVDLMIVDFGSSRILLDEFRRLWRDPAETLPPCDYSFAQFAWWVQDRKALPDYQRARRFWLDRLPDLPGPPQLPRRPGVEAAPRFVRRTRRISAEAWRRFADLAQGIGVTTSTALLAAYADILARWSDEQRFVINLTVFDRPALHPDIHLVVGDFTSLMLVEADARSGSFAERARRLQREISRCLEHRAFDAVEVLRARGRMAPDAALAPVVFTNTLDADLAAEASDGGMVELERRARSSQVWVDHTTARAGDDVLLSWTTLDDRFASGLIERMFEAYGRLVEALVTPEADWTRQPGAILPTPVDAREELDRIDDAMPPRLLHEGFLEQSAVCPGRIALICSGRTWTYRELLDAAQGVAAALLSAGVGRGEFVAVTMAKGWRQIAAVIGVLLAGAAYLPIDTDLPPARRRRYLEDAPVRLELADGNAVPLPESGVATKLFDEIPMAPGAAETVAVQLDDPCYAIFTSGSTGTPKAVTITHRAAANTVDAINAQFDIGRDDRVLALSGLGFDLSVYDIFGPLAVGGVIVLPDAGESARPACWPDLVTRFGVTIWNSVPALLQVLLDALVPDDPRARALRLVMLSGDWIPLDLPAAIRAAAPAARIIGLGGATEASIWSNYHEIDSVDPGWRSIPYGRPLPGQSIDVLHPNGSPAPVDVVGEIAIGGIGLAREYIGDPAKTRAAFRHGDDGRRRYMTGDLGRVDARGWVEILGRRDGQIKLDGRRVELGEVAAALAALPGGDGAVSLVRDVGGTAPRLCAFVFDLRGGQDPAAEEWHPLSRSEEKRWRTALVEALPRHMVPHLFVSLARAPLTENGKVDRALLARTTLATPAEARPAHDRAPSARETVLARIWQEVLGLDAPPAPGDSFVELGGNSLLAMRSLNRLNHECGLALGLAEVYANPTVEMLAALVDDRLLARELLRPSASMAEALDEGEL